MTAAEARADVKRELGRAARAPDRGPPDGRRFTLSAEDARVRADVGGMVDEALEASREGNVLSRVYRDAHRRRGDVDGPGAR